MRASRMLLWAYSLSLAACDTTSSTPCRNDDECAIGQVCTRSTGTCEVPAKRGQICNSPNNGLVRPCLDGLTCLFFSGDASAICWDEGDLSERCDAEVACRSELACWEGQCAVKPSRLDGPCAVDDDCPTGAYCALTTCALDPTLDPTVPQGSCTAQGEMGEPCGPSEPDGRGACADDLVCRFYASPAVCGAPGARTLDQTCLTSADCATGTVCRGEEAGPDASGCSTLARCRPRGVDGEACAVDEHCIQDARCIEDGVCSRGYAGSPCSESADCLFDFTCTLDPNGNTCG